MPDFRVTLFFNESLAGWSETYYWTGSDLVAANAAANALALMRSKTLADPDEIQLIAQRVQDVATPSSMNLKRWPGTPGKPALLSAVDMPWTGMLATATSVNGRRRQMIFRGVPDTTTIAPFNIPSTVAGWRDAFDELVKFLTLGTWKMQVLNKTANPLVDIENMAATAEAQLEVTKTAHGLATGDVISFYHVKTAYACVRGRHKIIRLSANAFTIPTYNIGRVGFISGQYRKVGYLYEALSSIVLGRKAARKPGRPFGLLRGRRSVCRH